MSLNIKKDTINPMYGKTHSLEARRKISESRKKYKMDKHPNWQGGRRTNAAGYVEIKNPGHHRSRKNGYVFEHILVVEEKIGRRLKEGEQVHHINEVKSDNSPENLEVLTAAEHTRLHAIERRTGTYKNCEQCGKNFYRKPSHAKRARYCSARCVGLASSISSVNNKYLTKEKLTAALVENNWNKKQTAKYLGIHWSTVYQNIKKLGVKKNA